MWDKINVCVAFAIKDFILELRDNQSRNTQWYLLQDVKEDNSEVHPEDLGMAEMRLLYIQDRDFCKTQLKEKDLTGNCRLYLRPYEKQMYELVTHGNNETAAE